MPKLPAHYPTIDRIAALQQFIADFSKIQRMLNLADTGRLENDVDHSFGLALTCWFLAPKIAPQLQLEKILAYALAHDTVELYAGDTFVFGPQELIDSKSAREDEALGKLAEQWPDFPELVTAAKRYKDKADPEARFVYVIDKLLPSIHVNLHEKDAYWHRHKITREMHEQEKTKKMQFSPEALPYLEALNEWLRDPDYFYKSDTSQ